MITNFKTPIKCPNCHKPLTLMQIQVTKVVEWTVDEECIDSAGRFIDNGQGATEVFCYNCKKQIGYYDSNVEWGLFPDSAIVDF